MTSATVWNRLEPSPRGDSIRVGLAAAVRDPLWLLARQWQLGEFEGADSGSPATVRVSGHTAALAGRSPSNAPIERAVMGAPECRSVERRIDAGQALERLLADASASDAVPAFRAKFPLRGFLARAPGDETSALVERLYAGAIDGIAVLEAVEREGAPAVVAGLDVPTALRAPAVAALKALATAWGPLRPGEPGAWRPDTLDYEFRNEGSRVAPLASGEIDWFSFDVPASLASAENALRVELVPTHVRARGIPNARYWDFEDASVDLGALEPDTADLAKMFLVDFLMTQSNDWFLVPLTQPAGTSCTIEELIVRDVFGVETPVTPADAGAPGEWCMFRPSQDGAVTRALVVPDAVSPLAEHGAPVEIVRFVQDPTLHAVWAVEELAESIDGSPLRPGGRQEAPAASGEPPRFVVQSDIPEGYVPLRQGSAGAPARRARVAGTGTGWEPHGVLLGDDGQLVQVEARALSRLATVIRRIPVRARGSDGTTNIWYRFERRVEPVAGVSPLRFDRLLD